MESNIKDLELRIANLEQEIFESNRIIAWLQEENIQIERRSAERLRELYLSTSWRITSPMRLISGFLKRENRKI
jgi:hypothetical protein